MSATLSTGTLVLKRSQLRPWAGQPRKQFDQGKLQELADSLRAVGLLQPLLVRALAEPEGEVTHEVIAGERRYRSSEKAGLQELECLVRELSDKQAIELAMMENLKRNDLTVIEEAEGYKRMVDLDWSVAEIADRFGKPKAFIYELLDLCALDEGTKEELLHGQITRTTARALGRIEEVEDRKKALQEVAKPRYQDTPLPEKRAVELIQTQFLNPQKRAKEWEKQKAKLEKEYAGAVIVPLSEVGKYTGWNSGWVAAEGHPPEYELGVHLKAELEKGEDENGDYSQEFYESVVPSWGKLAEKHGGQLAIVPDYEGNPQVMVNAKAVKEAELTAGEKDPTHCLFAIGGGDGRHQQSLVNQRAGEERKARQEKLQEWKAGLAKHLRDWLMGFERPAGPDVLHRELPALVEWAAQEADFLLDDAETMADLLGVDLEALGEGEDDYDRKRDGAKKWIRNLFDAKWGQAGAFLLLMQGLGQCFVSQGDFLERAAPLAKGTGFPMPEGLPADPDKAEEMAEEDEPDADTEEREGSHLEAESAAELPDPERFRKPLQQFTGLKTAKKRKAWLTTYFGQVDANVPGEFVEFAKANADIEGLTEEMEKELGEAFAAIAQG